MAKLYTIPVIARVILDPKLDMYVCDRSVYLSVFLGNGEINQNDIWLKRGGDFCIVQFGVESQFCVTSKVNLTVK